MEWLEDAVAHLGLDPKLAPLVAKYPKPGFVLTQNPFRDLVEAILSQQVSMKAGATVVGRFDAKFGGVIEPEALSATSVEDLCALGIGPQKAGYVHALAEAFAHGRWTSEACLTWSDEEVVRRLLPIRGIGRWTVDMFLIFSLGRPDVFPVGDYGVQVAMKHLFGVEAAPKPAQMREWAEPWRPFRSAASWYLWRSLETG